MIEEKLAFVHLGLGNLSGWVKSYNTWSTRYDDLCLHKCQVTPTKYLELDAWNGNFIESFFNK